MPSTNNNKDQPSAAVFSPKEDLEIDVPIGNRQHADSDLHLIDEALPAPKMVSFFNSKGGIGSSPNVAREDHAHQLIIGSATIPALGWNDLGFWRIAADVLGLTVSGVNRFAWDSQRMYAPGNVSIGTWPNNGAYGSINGNQGYLLLSHASDSNVYLRASGTLNLGATGYTDRVSITDTVVTIVPTISCNAVNGTAISCNSVGASGVVAGQTVNASFRMNAGERMYAASGEVFIGNIASGYHGIESSFGDLALGRNGVDGAVLLEGKSAGSDIHYRPASGGYNNLSWAWTKVSAPAGSGGTLAQHLNGHIVNTASRREFKENIAPLEETLDSGQVIDSLEPVTFIWRANKNEFAQAMTGNKAEPDFDYEAAEAWRKADVRVGLIADDVAEASPLLANWEYGQDAEGNKLRDTLIPGSWNEQSMITVLVAEIKSLRARVLALESA